jgi:hypothetical protein
MTTRMGLMVAVAVMLGGCAMEATEVPRDDDGTALAGRGREVSSGRFATKRSNIPVPPEFTLPAERVGWQDNALNPGPALNVEPQIPFKPVPDRP